MFFLMLFYTIFVIPKVTFAFGTQKNTKIEGKAGERKWDVLFNFGIISGFKACTVSFSHWGKDYIMSIKSS